MAPASSARKPIGARIASGDGGDVGGVGVAGGGASGGGDAKGDGVGGVRGGVDVGGADWPSNQFLFRMDPEHEAAITIMQGYIRSNFHACVVYSKQFEPYCRLVTAAKVGTLATAV